MVSNGSNGILNVNSWSCGKDLLISYGGKSTNGGFYYTIYSKSKDGFIYEIETSKLVDNIEKIKKEYQKYLRKIKLKKLNS